MEKKNIAKSKLLYDFSTPAPFSKPGEEVRPLAHEHPFTLADRSSTASS